MKLSRITFVYVFFVAVAGLISWRLYNLQIKNGDYYQALAMGQQTKLVQSVGERGKIFVNDFDGLAVLATQKETYMCFAVPKEIEDIDYTIFQLNEIFPLDTENLKKRFSDKSDLFVEIKDLVTDEEFKKIEESDLKGIHFKKKFIPYYPLGRVASNILGYVDREGVGKYGVQGYYDQNLRPSDETFAKEKGVFGYFNNVQDEFVDGDNIVLTIDLNIQKKAQELLVERVEYTDAEGGEIVILEPDTGKILAMANVPDYDPNEYSKFASSMETFKAGAVQDLYEPGSVQKAITMAIAIDNGAVTPDTTYVDEGFKKIDEYTIKNYNERVWGERTMTEILERSINTGVIHAQSLVEPQTFYNYLDNFGFFRKTGVGISGEAYSLNHNLKTLREVNLATASYGQGITITPLHLAVAYSAIANGGNIMKPYIVDRIIYPNGNEESTKPEIAYKSVIKESTARQVREMLYSVAENGYSQRARVSGYYIGGKTGTAQQPGGEGYTMKTWQTFAGIGPIFDPKFVIIIKLDNPQTPEASVSVAPVFSQLADYLFTYLRIPPERPIEPLKMKAVE